MNINPELLTPESQIQVPKDIRDWIPVPTGATIPAGTPYAWETDGTGMVCIIPVGHPLNEVKAHEGARFFTPKTTHNNTQGESK